MHCFYLTTKLTCHINWKPPMHSCPECFSTAPPPTFLAIAFTVLNLLLLCNLIFTSSMILSWLSFGYQKGLQVFYMTPALCFWFIVVSSVFHLFSFLDRSSLISTMPTKFHHCLQAWIHSMPVTLGVQTASPCFGGTTHCCFHPKYPSTFIRITIG